MLLKQNLCRLLVITEFCIARASVVIFLISEQNMSGIFTQSPANRRRYGVAIFVGIIAGIISAFVKWGAEHPFPPRSSIDFFAAACIYICGSCI